MIAGAIGKSSAVGGRGDLRRVWGSARAGSLTRPRRDATARRAVGGGIFRRPGDSTRCVRQLAARGRLRAGAGDGSGWSTSSSKVRTRGPCIVAVDDAHLLDDTSTFMLHQLVDRRLARLVLTVCSGAAVSGRRLGAVARQAASAPRPAAAGQGRLFDPARIRARRLGGSRQRAQAVEPDARQCELPAAHRRTGDVRRTSPPYRRDMDMAAGRRGPVVGV